MVSSNKVDDITLLPDNIQNVHDCLGLGVQGKGNVTALPELAKFMSKRKLSNDTAINLVLN